jgi:hypothetical protein
MALRGYPISALPAEQVHLDRMPGNLSSCILTNVFWRAKQVPLKLVVSDGLTSE